MPATEETYRSQPTLHVVFAISSIAMMLVIVWMIMADHLRPWKNFQREFHHYEEAKLKAAEKEKVRQQAEKSQAKIDQLTKQITDAKQLEYQNASEIRKVDAELDRVGGQKERLDTAKKFQKAELDSVRSLYDGMIDRDEKREARIYRDTIIVECERKLRRPYPKTSRRPRSRNSTSRRRRRICSVTSLTSRRNARSPHAGCRPGQTNDQAEGRTVFRHSRLDAELAGHRPHAPGEDPADQPSRADDQL